MIQIFKGALLGGFIAGILNLILGLAAQAATISGGAASN